MANIGGISFRGGFKGDALVTCAQDCSLIAQTFERAAHYDTKEESAFAVLSRNIENTKIISQVAQTSLAGYLISSSSTSANQLTSLMSDSVSVSSTEVDGGSLASVSVGEGVKSLLSDALGEDVMDKLKECIPCGDRIISLLELHPSLDFLSALQEDVERRLGILNDILDMLRNYDIYSDYCELLDILGDMCIPDLQRIIALLVSLIMFRAPKKDMFISLLRSLIGPLFAPILLGITSLLDQFSLILLSPLDCIIDHINLQIQKVHLKLDPKSPLSKMNNGLAELNKAIQDAKEEVQEKLEWYINQVKKVLGDEVMGSGEYVKLNLEKLKFLRLISFIVAIISAIGKGRSICSKDGRSPTSQELDEFINNFLNPNVNYSLRVDLDGNLIIDEQFSGYDDVFQSPSSKGGAGIQLNIDGDELDALPDAIQDRVRVLQGGLVDPIHIVAPCRLKTSEGDAGKIESWIEDLSKIDV